MKVNLLFYLLSITILFFAFSYCTGPTGDTTTYSEFDTETCNTGLGGEVTIDELITANSSNASQYRISGTCRSNSSEVRIFIEGFPLDEDPLCQGGQWQTSADLTGLINKKERFQIAVSTGGSGRLCQSVENHFICPDGYIGIAKLDRFTNRDFCVMKYEAKAPSRAEANTVRTGRVIMAESRTSGFPITRVTELEAQQYCRENGAGYDLITNSQWQSIARRIEVVDINWSRGRSFIESGNRINVGNTAGVRTDSDDRDEQDAVNWQRDRRYHLVSNGEYIWDFAGNLWEMVKIETPPPVIKYSGYVHSMPSQLKTVFGPERNYHVLQGSQREREIGLGFIRTNNKAFTGSVIRGGSNSQNAGIFSADTTRGSTGNAFRHDVGFRCIYQP